MSVHRIKHTFTAGELSPMMNVRADFERYKNGCKILENAFCATQGPAVRRPGFKFLDSISDHPVSHTIRYDDLHWERRNEYSGDYNPGIGYWNTNAAETTLRVNNVDGDGASQTNVLAGLGPGSVMIFYQTGNHLKFTRYTVVGSTPMGSWIKFEVTKGSSGSGGDVGWGDCDAYFRKFLTNKLAPVEPFRLVPFIFNENYSYMLLFANIAEIPGYAELGGMIMYVIYRGAFIEDENGNPLYLSALNSKDVPQEANGGVWDIGGFDYAQAGDELYIAQEGKSPCAVHRVSHTDWSLVEYVYTDQPTAWKGWNCWPKKVTFHQQRLAYANSLLHPQMIWLSKAGDFHDFGTSTTIQDDDAVTFRLASGEQNKIQWLLSAKALNVGTLGDEWTVTGSTQFALTPENILAQRQTNNGSENIKPLMVGITTLFVERQGRVVNEFVYDYTYDSYKTSDLAILSPHITEFHSITDWTFQQTPDSIIWCVRKDGIIVAITYQRQHKVVGWHRHITDGEVKNIASIPGTTREDDVYIVVKRRRKEGLNWVDLYYLERLEDRFLSEDSKDGRFLDSHLVYDGSPANTISGLEHLEGREVHILADGTVHPPVSVIGGSVTLNGLYSLVVVGLPYTTEIRPLVADIPMKDGTAFGRTQRVTNIDIDLYRSGGVWIGRDDTDDGEEEEEHPFRVPADPMDQAVPLFTGVKHIAFPEGFDRKTDYFIRQYQPLPLIVRGVIDTVEAYE